MSFTEIYGEELRNHLNATYESAKGSYDVFVLFIERAMRIVGDHGVLTLITPNKYLAAKYAVALREYILTSGYVEHLVDVSGLLVFEEAAVDLPPENCTS